MFLAKVVKRVVSTIKDPAYADRRLYVVQPVDPEGKEIQAEEWVAVDYLGSNIGDTVVCSRPPGFVGMILKMKKAPVRILIVAIVDRVNFKNHGRLEKDR